MRNHSLDVSWWLPGCLGPVEMCCCKCRIVGVTLYCLGAVEAEKKKMSGRKIRVGINGFGRIGRLVLRSAYRVPEIEIVAINTRRIHEDYMCYQFKYDSTHGRYKGEVEFDDKTHHMIVDGKRIKVYMHPDPSKIPWAEEDVDIVIESSGTVRPELCYNVQLLAELSLQIVKMYAFVELMYMLKRVLSC